MMGLNKITLDFLPKILKALEIDSWNGLKMLEYGNQIYKGDEDFKTSKEFFIDKGVKHVSVDINGRDGALPLDLRQAVRDVGEPFDIITNFGTTEHIRGEQYYAFRNMHDLVREGGVMASIVPSLEYDLPNHGDYHYSQEFFEELALSNGWNIYLLETRAKVGNSRKLVFFIAVKPNNNVEFMEKEDFNKVLKKRTKKIK
jgi:SAM-dependent methyltransferase